MGTCMYEYMDTHSIVSPPSPHHTNSIVSPPSPHHTNSIVSPPSPHHTNSIVSPPSPHHTNSIPISPSPPSNFVHHSCSVPPHPDIPPVLPPHTPPPVLLPRIVLPKTPEEWSEVNSFVQSTIVPAVLMESDVDVMNWIINHGLYNHLASRFGTMNANHHHQHIRQVRTKENAIKEVLNEKNAIKKQLRHLRKSNPSPEDVRILAHKFHLLVRTHSKLIKEARKSSAKANAKKSRKECHKNIHKFAKKILEDDNCASIQPTFSKDEAQSFFTEAYSSSPQTLCCPSWMPKSSPPSVPMTTCEFTTEELQNVITKMKSTSSPCPVDQIPYTVMKKCPSLWPALLHLFNCCWTTQSIPSTWKVGVIHLLGKKKAADDPSTPSNFRPIALTSCISKVFTSLVKRRWLSYMVTNNYLNTSVQKAFIDGVPGCTEHHLKLLSIIREAQKKHKSLSVCWLDLANAFGSVHHDLIRFSLAHYHAPPEMIGIVSNLYNGLNAVVSTKSWITDPIHLQKGVYQGDPLSVIIFNTVMNTLVDSITQCFPDLGYSPKSCPKKINLLQYADDTSLIADGPSSCQKILSTTESWLSWSGMKANVPKCVCVAISSSTGKPYNPNLTLDSEPIPYLADSTFHFLGAPVSVHSTNADSREHLLAKLSSLLQKVDVVPITRQQKLKMFKVGICPRLAWDLSASTFPITWLQTKLQPIATKYLKRWSGLARSADPNRLFLPKTNGGLDLPHLTTMYKRLQTAKATSYICSRDSVVRSFATQETLRESNLQRPVFRPFQEVVSVMKEDPGASKKNITSRVKAKIQTEDNKARHAHTVSLPIQGQTVRDFQGGAADRWSTAVFSLPEQIFKFALNAVTDTLPHNQNLFLWKKVPSPKCQLCDKDQSLGHILNGCKTALDLRRYNTRHDSVLEAIYGFLCHHLPKHWQTTVDLHGHHYTFPQDIAATNERPDIVIWNSSSIHLVELTIPFEPSIATAISRKVNRYESLREACQVNGRCATIITIEVGSRGFLHMPGFQQLYKLAKAKKNEIVSFELDVIRTAVTGSHNIWCKRNWVAD